MGPGEGWTDASEEISGPLDLTDGHHDKPARAGAAQPGCGDRAGDRATADALPGTDRGGAGGGGGRHPADRRHRPLRVPLAADLDRRTGPGRVPLARHDRCDRRAEPRRAYAHDRADRPRGTGTAAWPGGVRGGGGPGVPRGGAPTLHRIRPGGDTDRDAGSRRLEGLADGAAAVRLRGDDRGRGRQAVPRVPGRAGARADAAGRCRSGVGSDGGPLAGAAWAI